jgi:hypothetical protein
MIRRQTGTARRDGAAPGCDGECGNAHHRLRPDFGGAGCSAALPVHLTSGFTLAGESTDSGSAPRDEDVHSAERASLNEATRQLDHGDVPDGAALPATPDICQPCTHGGGLPLPRFSPPVPRSDLFCTVTPMDRRGRLADRSPIRAAGWPPGQPVTISASRDPHLVIVQACGPETITRDGHLRLPARIRHGCKLSAGDRLFITVTTAPPIVAVYPMATIETIIGQHESARTIADAQ